MKLFFSCDWGTSAFRLRLVDTENMQVLSEIKTGHGIAAAYECWQQAGQPEYHREAFYSSYIFEQANKINQSFGGTSPGIPILLSGMASSSIGMLELAYKEIPFQANGSNLVIHTIPAENVNAYKIIMISGARSAADVIRGEETMLAGCNIAGTGKEQLLIFPGTHSKHIIVKDNQVINFATYMTGELFDLLANKSILSASVKKRDSGQMVSSYFFEEGVIKGSGSNLANSIFHVRTNQLFKKMSPGENYEYLSGLLIGNELGALTANPPTSITLVCGEALKNAYEQALYVLGLSNNLQHVNAGEALVKGQWLIIQQPAYS